MRREIHQQSTTINHQRCVSQTIQDQVILNQASQISSVGRLSVSIRLALESASIKPSLAPADLFQAGDLESLAGFDDVNEFGRLQQREVCSRIEPCGASAKQFDVQRFVSQVNVMKI